MAEGLGSGSSMKYCTFGITSKYSSAEIFLVKKSTIKAAAEVLSHALRSSDTVGRLSGDEFAAIAVGMKLSHESKFRAKIKDLCALISKDRNFPFKLSMSLGAIEFNKETQETSLTDLLSLADDKLYIEKNKKHNKK